MPAKKKYLLQSSLGRTAKFTAALFGGLFAAISIHLAFAVWFDMKAVLSTTLWTMFIVWPGLMLLVYWLRKPWVSWSVMIGICLVSSVFIFLGKL